MFIIMVYDIKEKRVAKILKISRRYLTWIQNSVFEGDITYANFIKLKHELKKAIKKDEDSIVFYTFRTKDYTSREIMGIEKGKAETII
ncbi:MAG: CRISPR-associated endonuclease Cas2 [Candidatus Omnitrophica bacterium]|nr:CRISPR-associated endonuclease Cas2 [Candidatus Omnitrophota bacterium]